MGAPTTRNVTILNGQSLSDVLDMEGYSAWAIEMPAAWTVANLTFQAAASFAGTYNNVHDDAGAEVTVTAAAARAIGLDAAKNELAAYRFLKIRSGTSGVAVNQAADRVLTIHLK